MGTKDQEILNLIDEYFGQPEVYMWSTYILPNGHFLNPENVLKYAPDLETEIEYEHSDFTDLLTFFLEDGTEIPFYDVYDAMDNNCIKINVTYPYLALPKNRVTNKQLQAVDTILKNYLDHLEPLEWDGLMILAHKGSERLYDWTELLDTRQVIKDIRMSYVTGFLESTIFTESKADMERFVSWAGQSLANRFFTLKDTKRIKHPENDIYYWMRQDDGLNKLELRMQEIEETPTKREVEKQAKQEGAELLYEDSTWLVYKINTVEASCLYGKTTMWCISGDSAGDFFRDSDEYYFYFNKKTNEKYALIIYPNFYTIYTEWNTVTPFIEDGPKVEGLPDVNALEPLFIEGLSKININIGDIQSVRNGADEENEFWFDDGGISGMVILTMIDETEKIILISFSGTLYDKTEEFLDWMREELEESTQTKITDDLGRPLSKEQQNYFKNSKVRDANGNLLTVYHGTLADFTVFNNAGESTELGYHFGTKEAAKARNAYRVLESYLNITKPLEAPEDTSIWDAFGLLDLMLNLNMIPDLTEREYSFLASLWNSCGGCDPDEDLESWAEMQGLEVYDGLLDYERDWFDTIWVNEYMPEILEIITSRGYDGIYYINAVEDAGHISWIAFYPEQIKLVTNKTPTNSKDITESTNNKVLKTVEYKGFKIEVPDNLTLYHGTAAINEESIKLHGLDPRFSEFVGNYVWLETHYNTAVNWGKMHARDVLVYAVDVKDLDINLLELDYYNYEYFDDIITEYGYLEITDITFIYKGNIPPEALYLVD